MGSKPRTSKPRTSKPRTSKPRTSKNKNWFKRTPNVQKWTPNVQTPNVMKNGSNALLIECFHDHPGQPTEVKKDAGGGGRKKGGGKTVTSFFKSQLDDLMKVLYSTDPSFIRCVVPNTHKQPGGVQA